MKSVVVYDTILSAIHNSYVVLVDTEEVVYDTIILLMSKNSGAMMIIVTANIEENNEYNKLFA